MHGRITLECSYSPSQKESERDGKDGKARGRGRRCIALQCEREEIEQKWQ